VRCAVTPCMRQHHIRRDVSDTARTPHLVYAVDGRRDVLGHVLVRALSCVRRG
jgi:hypothetical protein